MSATQARTALPARRPIETLTRTIDAAATHVRKGVVKAVISTSEVDRFHSVILSDGVDFSSYEALGRPICYEHGLQARGLLPVGVAERCERTTYRGKRAIVIEARFSDDDEFSRMIGERYRSQQMRGWSIHCAPQRGAFGRPTSDELRAHPEWQGAEVIYRASELLEISCVAIPGNASTVTTDVLRSGGTEARMRAEIREAFASGGQLITDIMNRRTQELCATVRSISEQLLKEQEEQSNR
jgi:hypothetical protein